MRLIETAIGRLAETDRPLVAQLALDGTISQTFSGREIVAAAAALVARVRAAVGAERALGGICVGVVCGNTVEFVVADLAAWLGGFTQIPLPLAFSRVQAESLLQGVTICLADEAGVSRLHDWGADVARWQVLRVHVDDRPSTKAFAALRPRDEDWICKIIHTSGTTSHPKGVKIRAAGLNALLRSLLDEMPPGSFARYLSTVPLSLLIEQVTAIYMVLLHEGTLVLLPSQTPLVGSNPGAAAQALPYLHAARPSAMVMAPALVEELHRACLVSESADRSLLWQLFGSHAAPLICCGGAPINPALLAALDDRGIAVYEGYGLSENGSVVTWNRPAARRIGSVGKPLSHVQVRVADDGELLVKSSSLFAGYTVEDPSSLVVDAQGWLHTGDLASIDADGFVYITGRKKNVIITSSGRNVAPEWVEAQYATLPFVTAVAVVGNRMPVLHGLFLLQPEVDPDAARHAIEEFGARHMSTVERVQVAHLLSAQVDTYRRFFTVTGRPQRAQIEAAIMSGALGPEPPTTESFRSQGVET